MTEQQATAERFEGWAELHLFGHQRLIGYVADVELFGGRFARLDKLSEQDGTPGETLYFSPGAIYSVVPSTEEAIRAEVERALERSRQRLHYLAAPRVEVEEEDDHDDEDDLPPNLF